MKKENKNAEKWAWATPEKLNPESEKHAMQGAVLLIVLGVILTAAGLYLAVKYKFFFFEEFTGLEYSRRNLERTREVIFLFNLPWIAGVFLLGGGLKELLKRLKRRG